MQTVLDIPSVGTALLDVLAVFKELSRQKKLTRKTGLGSAIYLFCKEVEQLTARTRVIAARVHQLSRGISERSQGEDVFDLLYAQLVYTKALLQNLLVEDGPYAKLFGDDELESIKAALKSPVLSLTNAGAVKATVLEVERGERSIKNPEDIAERLVENHEGSQNIREIEQAVASLKSRLGKEFDPAERTDTRRAK